MNPPSDHSHPCVVYNPCESGISREEDTQYKTCTVLVKASDPELEGTHHDRRFEMEFQFALVRIKMRIRREVIEEVDILGPHDIDHLLVRSLPFLATRVQCRHCMFEREAVIDN